MDAKSKKRDAFTLAEVLITLGIIGVVAAITLPTLIKNYQKKTTVTKLQKIYAELNQAVRMAESEHGLIEEWSWDNMEGATDTEKVSYFAEEYISKHLKIGQVCDINNLELCMAYPFKNRFNTLVTSLKLTSTFAYSILTQSGYSIFFWSGGVSPTSLYPDHCLLITDINGPKNGKNIMGQDIFLIIIRFNKQWGVPTDTSLANNPGKQGVYMMGNGSTPPYSREELLDSCSGNIPYGCGALIQNDGWEIKDDYPW